ncbi:ABC transporter ATP-binding protein [Elioraea thermophila]|uniref:ABC transporter ATP-binding protein n=1 Tax=Elioraea thermophila TaxID=2185104 RepID=UPI000DF4BFD8|nr:ABC transporter ATP-binding protein [Elioraea thermophila]
MTDPLVRFDRVAKSYDRATLVIPDLSFEVGRGEFLTLLGPSGSGKTTTLMMLAGFEAPDRGRILLEGRDIVGVPAHRRNIGVVFQSYALFPHLTVAQNVAFPLSVRGRPRAEIAERVARALAMVRLEGLGDRRPSQLSGGQQQRVALARALVFEPKLVLMDEPLGALDKQLRAELQAEIRRLHRELGVTIVYVTHDQEEALALSDRIAVFNEGRIRQIGPPQALYDHPRDPFVAGFIGENNRLEGEVVGRDEDGQLAVRLGGGAVVRAEPVDVAPATRRVLLSVRPERIALAHAEAEDLGADALAATVVETVFLGDHVRVRVRLADGGLVTVKRPAYALDARLKPGARVALAWSAEHAIAFAADGTEAARSPLAGHV